MRFAQLIHKHDWHLQERQGRMYELLVNSAVLFVVLCLVVMLGMLAVMGR
jgi:hypothetical protein